MIAVGIKNRMTEQRCKEIYDEVKSGCGDLLRYHLS